MLLLLQVYHGLSWYSKSLMVSEDGTIVGGGRRQCSLLLFCVTGFRERKSGGMVGELSLLFMGEWTQRCNGSNT